MFESWEIENVLAIKKFYPFLARPSFIINFYYF
jgi:hypothetical protein